MLSIYENNPLPSGENNILRTCADAQGDISTLMTTATFAVVVLGVVQAEERWAQCPVAPIHPSWLDWIANPGLSVG